MLHLVYLNVFKHILFVYFLHITSISRNIKNISMQKGFWRKLFYLCEFVSFESNSLTCADPESLARGGPTLTTFFYEGREDPTNSTNSGPSFKW